MAGIKLEIETHCIEEFTTLARLFGQHIRNRKFRAKKKWLSVGLRSMPEVGKSTFVEAAASAFLRKKVTLPDGRERYAYSTTAGRAIKRQIIVTDSIGESITTEPLLGQSESLSAICSTGLAFREHAENLGDHDIGILIDNDLLHPRYRETTILLPATAIANPAPFIKCLKKRGFKVKATPLTIFDL